MNRLLLFFCALLPNCVVAQLNDDTMAVIDHSSPGFPAKQLLLPAALVVYGVSALHNPTLQHANDNIREELWMERPHTGLHIDNYLQYAPAAAVFGLNALGIRGRHSATDAAAIYGLSNLMLNAIVYSTKQITKEMRPAGTAATSFPSGHTAEAFASAELLRLEYQDVSPWFGLAGYAAAAATGYLRIYNNKHWLSDVCAGAGIGIISTDFAYWLYPKIVHRVGGSKHSGNMVIPTYAGHSFRICWIKSFR